MAISDVLFEAEDRFTPASMLIEGFGFYLPAWRADASMIFRELTFTWPPEFRARVDGNPETALPEPATRS